MGTSTIQAVRQVIYLRLTTPPITYTINGNAMPALTAANVSGRPQYASAPGSGTIPPSPYIAYTVGVNKNFNRMGERVLNLKIWVSSNALEYGDDEVTELYEQGVRARLHTADTEGANGWPITVADLSRPDTSGSSLGVAIRECVENRMLPAGFEEKSGRWYVSADYTIVAN